MLILYGGLLFLIGAGFFLITPLLWVRARSLQLADPRTIICPETRRWATVTVDGVHAARAELAGRVDLRLVACSRWPQRQDCDQGCVPQLRWLGTIGVLPRMQLLGSTQCSCGSTTPFA